MQTVIKQDIIVAIISLVIAIAIYILFRNDIWAIESLGFGGLSTVTKPSGILFDFFCYSIPDALWYFSLLILQHRYLRMGTTINIILWYCAVLLPFVWELLQFIGCISGTYDVNDVVAYLITLLIVIIWKRRI